MLLTKSRIVMGMACLLLFGVAGCQKFIDLDVNQQPEKWILYGTLRPEEILRVELYRTQPVVGVVSDSFWVSNASVWLLEEGADSVRLEEVGRGIYETTDPVEVGKSYALRAYHPRLPQLATEDLFLPPPPDVTFSVQDSVVRVDAKRFSSLLTVTFPDSLASPVVFFRPWVEANEELFDIQTILFSTSPLPASCYSGGNAIYIDLPCTGSRSFLVDMPEYRDTIRDILPIDAFVLEVGLSSNGELDFFKAAYQEEGFELGISTPVLLPENIRNGYGYWSIASGRVLRIER